MLAAAAVYCRDQIIDALGNMEKVAMLETFILHPPPFEQNYNESEEGVVAIETPETIILPATRFIILLSRAPS